MRPTHRIALLACLITTIVHGAVVAPPFNPLSTATVNLAWDPPLPTLDGTAYILYASTNATFTRATLSSAVVRIPMGTNLATQIINYPPGRWIFAVTAIVGGVETPPSNFLPVDINSGPRSLRRTP